MTAMRQAQIVSVTTREVGPAGPVRRFFAVAVDDPEAALEAVQKRLGHDGTARWIDTRTFTLQPGEVLAL